MRPEAQLLMRNSGDRTQNPSDLWKALVWQNLGRSRNPSLDTRQTRVRIPECKRDDVTTSDFDPSLV